MQRDSAKCQFKMYTSPTKKIMSKNYRFLQKVIVSKVRAYVLMQKISDVDVGTILIPTYSFPDWACLLNARPEI